MRTGVVFPPGDAGVVLPLDSRRAAALGVTLYTASEVRPQLIQWVAWATVRTIGPRVLPAQRLSVADPPLQEIEEATGPIRAIALYRRRDSVRRGETFVAELARGGAVLIKIREDAAKLDRERAVLRAAGDARPTKFGVPAVRGQGTLTDGRTWSAQEMVFTTPHRPCLDPPVGFADDLARVTALVASRVDLASEEHPRNWAPAHGDLTPWNLRLDHRGRPWLLDWEDIRWAPADADAAYFAATLGVVRPGRGMLPISDESRAFWTVRVQKRLDEGHPHRENDVILRRLLDAPTLPSPGGR